LIYYYQSQYSNFNGYNYNSSSYVVLHRILIIQHLIYVTKLYEPVAELNTRRLELYSESSWQVALQLLRTLMLTLTAGRWVAG